MTVHRVTVQHITSAKILTSYTFTKSFVMLKIQQKLMTFCVQTTSRLNSFTAECDRKNSVICLKISALDCSSSAILLSIRRSFVQSLVSVWAIMKNASANGSKHAKKRSTIKTPTPCHIKTIKYPIGLFHSRGKLC